MPASKVAILVALLCISLGQQDLKDLKKAEDDPENIIVSYLFILLTCTIINIWGQKVQTSVFYEAFFLIP